MEQVKEIVNALKERFTNPFIFSFIASWLILNWEIPIALLFYDKEQLKLDGCNTYIDFIRHYIYEIAPSKNLCKFNALWSTPLVIALAYTVIFPFIRELINLFNTWVIKISEEQNLKILKNGQISVDKYMLLRTELKGKIEALNKLLQEETKLKEDNQRLNNLINDKDRKFKELQEKTDSSILNGCWDIKVYNSNDQNIFRAIFKIYSNEIFILQENTDSYYRIGHIRGFVFNYDTYTYVEYIYSNNVYYNYLKTHLSYNKETDLHVFTELKKGGKTLTGKINDNINIEYTSINIGV